QAQGMAPDFVLGHSVGEVAAAHIAGALTLDQAVRVIRARSIHQERVRGTGAMAALAWSESEARAAIGRPDYHGVEIAASNSHRAVTLAGPRQGLQALVEEALGQGIAGRLLDIDYPFHTAALEPAREPLLADLVGLAPSKGSIAFLSTVS